LDSEIIQDTESAKRREPNFDINYVSYQGSWTLFLLAVRYRRQELVDYLLKDPNINVNYRDYYCIPTSICENASILKSLLKHKDINVNVQNYDEQTVLHLACYNNQIEIAGEVLLDARVDILIRDYWKETALDIAKRCKYHEIANILKKVLRTPLLRIPNRVLCRDIIRMIIEEYVSL